MLLARDCMYESSFFEIGALPSAIAAIISSPVSREEGAPRAAARPAAECNRAPPDPVRCHANKARGGGALGDCRCFWSLEPELIATKGGGGTVARAGGQLLRQAEIATPRAHRLRPTF